MATCKHCQVTISHEVEPHWSGWLDESGDALSYVSTLHDHEPADLIETAREVWGTSEDGKRQLVIVGDNAYIWPVGATAGRWECSARHLASFVEVYRPRFPR